MSNPVAEGIRTAVRERYGQAARAAAGGTSDLAGAGSSFGPGLYDPAQLRELPTLAVEASLGCGNPTALADLLPGQVVLDLGAGAGIDVLLSARRVGPTGKAYGLDMTPEMLELSRRNQAEAGVTNAEFMLGAIEQIPLSDDSVDVIVSNCVINLAADKDAVLAEAHRVLRPGGLFAVSDVVLRHPLPAEIADLVVAWTGCVAGALTEDEYVHKLEAAGFSDIEVVPTLIHDRAAVERFACCVELPADLDRDRILADLDGVAMNAFVRARAGV